ncbi:hypothetical protein M422DRAFT_252559 [Sphaerobolus stellatus SS14]|uniref:Uncharacterized protein n=1 Tax=Sphaerobolus stellatus (strain SS14) TaxID=990650 RepID=A0A0C9VZR5_SPHS4|nr:hypothetical protein M422DRAFT_252559 [Sphaerobolus stellatus SS14]
MLLQLEVKYEIRRLCITVMLAFLQTYPTLALKILRQQLDIVATLAGSLNYSMEDPLFSRMRDFLDIAFTQYEVAGLFWLLSKQGRLSEEFFVMLHQVVNHTQNKANQQGESLRDSIVRDTLSKVAANINDTATPDALYNLERYVTVCYHELYPSALMQHIGLRMTAIARQTADLHTSGSYYKGFDPNPLLLMAAIIIQHNESGRSELLSHIETLLRVALTRFNVTTETLKRLLALPNTTHGQADASIIKSNPMASVVLDVLSESLKGKTRASSATLVSILELMTTSDLRRSSFHNPSVLLIAQDAILYLSYPIYRESYGQTEFSASLAAAKLISIASQEQPSILRSALGDSRSPATVRVWNLLAIAVLETADEELARIMVSFIPQFVSVYSASLRIPSPLAGNDTAALNVNHAFASIKLWILLTRKLYSSEAQRVTMALGADNVERMIWNELWPPFERLFVQALGENSNGEKPPVFTFICSCVSDIMLFLRQARSVIALDTSSHVSILNTLRASSYGEGPGAKFTRAERSISEMPSEIPFDVLITQARQDVLTAEKLQVLDSRRQAGYEKRREYIDRNRPPIKNFRNPSQ